VTASIVTAGIEALLPIIIVFVVIGRIFAAIKKASSGSQPTPGAAGRPKIEQDLQKFFENIANQQGPAQEEQPPPPPVPVTTARRAQAIPTARRAEAPAPQPVVAAAPMPYTTDPTPWSGKPFGPDAPKRSTCSSRGTHPRAELVRMLKDGNSIRKAVLLREILGHQYL
jgi:hypothetical protein